MKPSRLAQLLVMTVAFLILVACGGTGGSDPRTGEPFDPGDTEIALELVNLFRSEARECGGTVMPAAPALTTDNRLTTAAQLHSDFMAETGYVGHDGRDGSSFAQRAKAQGYDYLALAENVAGGDGLPDDADAILAWIGSTGHCQNLMRPEFEHMGIAVAISAGGLQYWTQVLGAE